LAGFIFGGLFKGIGEGLGLAGEGPISEGKKEKNAKEVDDLTARRAQTRKESESLTDPMPGGKEGWWTATPQVDQFGLPPVPAQYSPYAVGNDNAGEARGISTREEIITKTESKSEITIRDETGMAKITKAPETNGNTALKLKRSGEP
jgi:hypothetical protein